MSICFLRPFCSGNSTPTVPFPGRLPECSLKTQTMNLCVAESLASWGVDQGKFSHSEFPRLSASSASIAARDPGGGLLIHGLSRLSSSEAAWEKDKIAGL